MKKCLLWGTGKCFFENINLIKYHELKGSLAIVGVTSNNMMYENYSGYKFICKKELKKVEFDCVIVMATGAVYKEICLEAMEIGIAEKNIFEYRLLGLGWFEIDKYLKLRENIPTIFSCNCWGGLTYHTLGLEFKSPFINMFLDHTDYIKLLREPQYYLEHTIDYFGVGMGEGLGKEYPIGKCGDIYLHFNHSNDFESAVNDWERRKQRINWTNLFIMMYDEDPKIAYEFAQLPYKNKICFVPFETNVDSLFYINFRKRMSDKPFWQIVNMLANNTLELYNPIDLLKGENTMFEAIYYEVASIDGDYANLRRIDDPSADIKLVARALLPAEIMEGTKLKYELMQYEIC